MSQKASRYVVLYKTSIVANIWFASNGLGDLSSWKVRSRLVERLDV